MKRAAELVKLSHDHHHGLVLARRIKESLPMTQTALVSLRRQVHAEREDVLIKHFDLEEKFLGPPLQRAGRSQLVDRLLGDHTLLRTLAGRGQDMTANDIQTFGSLLEEHIRFEERELFEEAQRTLARSDWEALADAIAGR